MTITEKINLIEVPATATPYQSKSTISARHTTTLDETVSARSSHASSLSTAAVLLENIFYPDTSRYRIPGIDWYYEHEANVCDKVVANTTDWKIVFYFLRETKVEELGESISYNGISRILEWCSPVSKALQKFCNLILHV
jgi:hypothetical protein